MTTKEKFLKALPKKYHERVEDIYAEDDLIDNCKYILLFKKPYVWSGEYMSLPVFSFKEAMRFVKEAEPETRKIHD